MAKYDAKGMREKNGGIKGVRKETERGDVFTPTQQAYSTRNAVADVTTTNRKSG